MFYLQVTGSKNTWIQAQVKNLLAETINKQGSKTSFETSDERLFCNNTESYLNNTTYVDIL